MLKKLPFWVRSPFVVFTVLLLFKMYLTQMIIFDDASAWLPILNGLPAVWVVFLLIEWRMTKRKIMGYFIANLIMTAIYFAAIMYHQYFGVIVTYHALQQVNQVTEVKGSVFQLLHPYFLLVFLDVVILAYFLFRKKTRSWGTAYSERVRTGAAGLMLLLIVVCFFSIWNGRFTMNEIKQAEQMGILNYEVYTFFPDGNANNNLPTTISQAEISKLKGISTVANPTLWKAAEGKNVIILQLEAFQNLLLNQKLDGVEVTPNLNALLKESMYFPNFYQMVGQGNTSDAEVVVNTSVYIPPHGAASIEYADKDLPSLPKLFKQIGYESMTFHTNDITFWNREELYKALGFDRYYDKAFFGDADPIALAASDEVLYDKTAAEMEKLHNKNQLFYAQLISLSAHYPFQIPENKHHLKLPDRYENTFVGDYIQAQNYTDYSLGLFIDKLKASHLWENSLFVIYGDHMGLPIYSLSDTDDDLLHEMLGKNYSFSQMLNIPLLIVAPGTTKPAVFTQAGGQVDILPTVANLVGISLDNQLHFGQDIINTTTNLLPEHYYLPRGSLINNSEIFIPGKGFADGIKHPLNMPIAATAITSEEQFNNALKLFKMSDSYVNNLPKHK
ncbi:LTA synthase family protein [Paenibacillus psychroresistens]|nr:LTA synthase family protein [Paenibacillus psychroresistens]